MWSKKRKGNAVIYINKIVENAIVDNKGLGINPGIFWRGIRFKSVEEAKIFAEMST